MMAAAPRVLPFLFFLMSVGFLGCSSQIKSTKEDYSLIDEHKELQVPFIAQTTHYCGPAALTMIAQNLGVKTNVDDVAGMIYTPEAEGTFQNDLWGGVRRLGLLSVPAKNLKRLLQEIEEGRPVLVFLNLGFSWFPKWHYAVVVGYDLPRSEIILHSGETKNLHMALSTFQDLWKRTHNWGLLIGPPGTLFKSASEFELVEAGSGLEITDHLEEAKVSYEKMLKKWPSSLGAWAGLGNVYYRLNDLKEAKNALEKAAEFHPQVAGVWHNYALVLEEMGDIKGARSAAKKTIDLSTDSPMIERYREDLKNLL